MAVEIPEQFLHGLKQDYDDWKAQNCAEKQKCDGDTRSATIQTMVQKLDEFLPQLDPDSASFATCLAIKASILYETAKRQPDGSAILLEALNILEPNKQHKMLQFLYLRIVNHLAYSLTRSEDFDKARELLESVIDGFVQDSPLVYSTEELLSGAALTEIEPTGINHKLIKLQLNNMQMLCWIYSKLNLHELHTKLQNRIVLKLHQVQDSGLDFIVRLIRLASLYLTQNRFPEARYHISVALTILDDLDSLENLHFVKVQADLHKCVVYYCLHLFGQSRLNAENLGDLDEEVDESLQFPNLDPKLMPIACTCLLEHGPAKQLFDFALNSMKKVQFYYNLRDHPLEYVNTVFDVSELHKNYATFCLDLDTQYDVQRARMEYLEQFSFMLKEYLANCYLSVRVELIKELTEVQLELMTINLKKLYQPEVSPSEAGLRQRISAVQLLHSKLEATDFPDYSDAA